MKIRVIKSSDSNDVGVLNLSKAFAVRKKAQATPNEGAALAVYYPGAPCEMVFPETDFKFEHVEISMDGTAHYSPTDIDKIVVTFTMLG